MPQDEPKFMLVPLNDIHPDPDQPRRFFDEGALQELTDSIREKGVLQPILLRPHPVIADEYMIVCGERRCRAAKSLEGIDTIPAIFRDISKDEALELQIIENLQRKDVHPMEEAAGFQSLIEHKQLTVDEIAARVAKSVSYVRKRLKLNNLIDGFQKAYFQGRMTSKVAVLISSFTSDVQEEIFEKKKDDDQIELSDWELRNYQGDLNEVAFSLADDTLDPKMGACTNCIFNSATASLFPGDEENPTCRNIKCLTNKSKVHFDRELAKAMEDPTMVFVDNGYNIRVDKAIKEKLSKEGFIILESGYYNSAFQIERTPEKPELSEPWDEDDEEEQESLQQAYQEELKEYEVELKNYKETVASGKYQRAFVVDGTGKGTYVYGTMPKNKAAVGSTTATKAKEKAGKLTIDDIDAEIERLEARERRSKELDAEKVHTRIIEAVKESNAINEVPAKGSETNLILMLFILNDQVGWTVRKQLDKIGIGEEKFGETPQELHKQLLRLTTPQITFLIRQIIFDRYQGSSTKHIPGHMFRLMAESLGTIPIEAFEQEQQEKAEKRAAKVEKRILELMEKRAALQTQKSKTPKKKK